MRPPSGVFRSLFIFMPVSYTHLDVYKRQGEKQGNVYYATVKTDVTLYFNAEFGTYTHRWVASETNEAVSYTHLSPTVGRRC